jgi:enterochelin esterase-like enzyme
MNYWQSPVLTLRQLWRRQSPKMRQIRHWYSPTLDREVDLDIYLPPDYKSSSTSSYPLVLFNDGQDLPRMDFATILERLYQQKQVPYMIVVGIYASHNRIREYGTARQPDYKNRGDLAGQYREFILEEVLPFVRHRFRTIEDPSTTAFAGFSLGGLSALDIGWSAPHIFGKIGVFSGALWWRWEDTYSHKDPDAARIIHDIIRTTPDQRPNHQCFWFECGTDDEEDDRNNNGVIDAIDDTIDCIRELKLRGYHESQIRYLEIEDGRHEPQTWGQAMPDFLRWAFIQPQGD